MSWRQVTTFKGNRQIMRLAVIPRRDFMYIIKLKKLQLLSAYQVKEV